MDYVGRKGWAERRRRILDVARTVYAIATIRRKLDLKAADFKEAAIELYYRINRGLCHSDLTALRQVHICNKDPPLRSKLLVGNIDDVAPNYKT